jgi:hypothetical protein
LERWQTAFRAAYDRNAANIFDEPADARRRRKVIERTFGDLAERALVLD